MTVTSGRQAALRPRGDQRKRQIASIAAELFCERGFHSVGLGEIAGAAGITGPAIYRHFRNKQAILAYAARDFAGVLTECAEKAAVDTGSAQERLDNAVESVVRLVVEWRGKVRLYQWEHRHLAPEDRSELYRRIRELVTAVAGLVHAVRPELHRQEAMLLSSSALSGIASLSTHRVSMTDRAAERGLRAIASAVFSSTPPARSVDSYPARGQIASGFSSRREQLLAVAVQLFHERGFHAVSMDEIGTEAGINASSVYRHYASKADLLAAVYYRAADRLEATTASAVEAATDSTDALHRLVRAYVRFAFGHRHLAAVYLSEHRNLPVDDRHALRRAQRDHVAQWVRLAGGARPDRRPVQTQLVVHAALNIVHDGALNGGRVADEDQAAHIARTVLEI